METIENGQNTSETQAAVAAYFSLPFAVLDEIQESTAMVPQMTLDQWIHELNQQRETGLKGRIAEAINAQDSEALCYLGALAHRQAVIGARLRAARQQVTKVMRQNYNVKPETKRVK